MTNLEFAYWIKGFVNLSEDEYIDFRQLNIIQNHLNLVQAVNGEVRSDIEACMTKLRKLFQIKKSILKKDFDDVWAKSVEQIPDRYI